ncbi:MAG: hypothetical protein IPO92_06790 [Saprospiraceae bacterium]|nr:hypothetical protein [Saprospiraceae bacterium]
MTKINGQTDTIDIKNTINRMFKGMSTFDSSMVRSTFTTDFTLQSIIKTKDGNTHVRTEQAHSFLKSIGTKSPGLKYDERLLSYDIHIDDDLAIGWTPYSFYLNDVFSHCGVNVFTLVKLNGIWKIMSIVDTRRKNNCLE